MWRFWANRTSFYVKARNSAMGAIKVSLHGPDDRPTVGAPHFRYGFDRSVTDRSGALHADGFEERRFPGERINDHVRRVLRIRVPWDMLQPGVPSGLGKTSLTRGMEGGVVNYPSVGYAVDLDVFLSNRTPYWPASAAQMARDNAGFGPYRNEAGQYLTIASIHRSMFRHPSPDSAQTIPPMNRADAVRGAYFGIEDDADPENAYPWIVESMMSRRALADVESYRRPLPVRPRPFTRPACATGPLTLT